MSIHQKNGTLNTPEAAHDLETMESLNERVKEAMRAEEEAQRQYNAIAYTGKQGVPDAPFKGAPAWSELMVKRMVRWAVKHGYDGIALTPGEIQDERNDLSKTISQVRLFPAGDEQYRLTAYDEDTHVVLDDTYTRDALPGVIGKEATEKLLAMEPDRFGVRTLVGLDLKTGGKFHYQLYDTIIPNILNKIGKRFGSKVEGIKLNRAGKLTPQEEAIVQESNRIEEEIRAAKKEVEKARIETLHTELTEQEVNEGARRKLLENEVDAMNRFDKLVIARNEWMHKNYKVITKHQQLQADKDLEKNAHFLPITPEMRKGVTEQGFPLFNLVYKAPPAFEPTLAESYRKQGDAWTEIQRIGFRPPSDPSKVAEWERKISAALERFNAAKANVEGAEKGIGEVHDLQNGARVLFLRRAGLRSLHIGYTGGNVRPGSTLNGVTFTKDQLRYVLDNLDMQNPPHAKELKAALLQAMDDKDGSVTVSTPREDGMSRREWLSILYEELFHTSERNYPLSDEQWMQLNASIPDAFNDHLAYNYEMGDDGTLKRAKMRAKEAIAHFAAGRPEEYGMSQEEMASYLFQYYDALTKTHGPDALEKLKGLAIEARRVREEYKNATGTGRLQRTDRDNRSLPEGGQAGTSGTGEEAGRGEPQEPTSGPRGDREGGSTEAPKPAVEPQASQNEGITDVDALASLKRISPQEAIDQKMFGPVYHGTTADLRQKISEEGFKVFEGEAASGDIRHGYTGESYGLTGIPAPVHHLGYGVYLTTVKNIGKQYNEGSGKGLKSYYIDAPRVAEINFGSPNTMMKWWVKNGYNPAVAMRDRVAATKMLTDKLKEQYDAVWFKGKGIRRLLDGDQIVVFDPERIREVDNTLVQPGQVGSKIIRKIDGMKGVLASVREIPEEYREKYHKGNKRFLEIKWAKGGKTWNDYDSDVDFVGSNTDSNITMNLTRPTPGESALHSAGPKSQSEILEAAKAKPLNRQAELHLRNPNNHFVRSPDGMLHVFSDKESAFRFHAAAEAIK